MSNEFAFFAAKPCGNGVWKKSVGKGPFTPPTRVAFTIALMALYWAVPDGVLVCGWLLATAHALYSAVESGVNVAFPDELNETVPSFGALMKSLLELPLASVPEVIWKFG